jgi:hypothetical protein
VHTDCTLAACQPQVHQEWVALHPPPHLVSRAVAMAAPSGPLVVVVGRLLPAVMWASLPPSLASQLVQRSGHFVWP